MLIKSGHMRTQGGGESVEKSGHHLENSNFYQNFISLNSVLCASRQHLTQQLVVLDIGHIVSFYTIIA